MATVLCADVCVDCTTTNTSFPVFMCQLIPAYTGVLFVLFVPWSSGLSLCIKFLIINCLLLCLFFPNFNPLMGRGEFDVAVVSDCLQHGSHKTVVKTFYPVDKCETAKVPRFPIFARKKVSVHVPTPWLPLWHQIPWRHSLAYSLAILFVFAHGDVTNVVTADKITLSLRQIYVPLLLLFACILLDVWEGYHRWGFRKQYMLPEEARGIANYLKLPLLPFAHVSISGCVHVSRYYCYLKTW